MKTMVDKLPDMPDECQYSLVITTPEYTLETENDYTYCALKHIVNNRYGKCDLANGLPCGELITYCQVVFRYT